MTSVLARLRVRGRACTIRETRLPRGKLGRTIVTPQRKSARVDLALRLQPVQMVEVLLHEMLHAYFNEELGERAVAGAAKAQAEALFKVLRKKGIVT